MDAGLRLAGAMVARSGPRRSAGQGDMGSYRDVARMRYYALHCGVWLATGITMTARSTSFRISEIAKARLAERAAREGISATALLERMIVEGVDALEHPGITFRGPPHDRRAALAAGPDVWEVIARLRELAGSEEQRIVTLADETDLHPRQIRLVLDFAAAHPDDIRARIDRNESEAERSQRAARQREALLG